MAIDVNDLPPMGREAYISFMENYGFPPGEAVKMADYAIPDFGSYEAAYDYYTHDASFWIYGGVYAGHRKARRTFWLDREKKKQGVRKMPVDVRDLPPAYQAQALRKLMEQERKKGRGAALSPAAGAPQKESKYHNKPTERVTPAGKVLRFDSQKEARRYDELAAMEQAGQIRGLRMQVEFTLQEAYTDPSGQRVRAIRYRADFTYRKVRDDPWEEYDGSFWTLVVEDVKSRATKTRVYEMKKKLMREKFGIEIQEI